MQYFQKNFKRYIFNRSTLIVIAIGFFCLIVSFIVRNYDSLKELIKPNINTMESQGLDMAAKLRQSKQHRDFLCVDLFNFDSYIRSAQWIYLYLVNIFAILPSIIYFDKRKSGYLKSVLMRTHFKKYLWSEGLSITVAGGIIAFIPYLVYWLIGAIFIPNNVGEDMGLVSTYFREYQSFNPFSFLHVSIGQLKLYWLVYIVMIGIYGICISFLTFVFANIVSKKAVLFVVPLGYYYLVTTVMDFFHIQHYSILGLISYFSQANNSTPNILIAISMIIIVSLIIYSVKVTKEKVVNV